MNSRERVIRAIERSEPDRVPLTHATLPGAYARYGAAVDDLYERYPADVVNVGSVGQPRDRDPRAAYVVINGDSEVEFIRVEYDLESAMRKILAVSELDDFLGNRLLEGR